jgi:hypothetical protein
VPSELFALPLQFIDISWNALTVANNFPATFASLYVGGLTLSPNAFDSMFALTNLAELFWQYAGFTDGSNYQLPTAIGRVSAAMRAMLIA